MIDHRKKISKAINLIAILIFHSVYEVTDTYAKFCNFQHEDNLNTHMPKGLVNQDDFKIITH